MPRRANGPTGVKGPEGRTGPPSFALEHRGRVDGCRDLIQAIPAIVWRADAQTLHVTFVSRYAETLLGYPTERWTDEPTFWADHVYPQDREFITKQRDSAIKAAGVYDLEYRMTAADGRVLWVREFGRVVPGDGPDGALVGFLVDLSRKRSEKEALGESKLWLREVVDTIPQQIWSGPADGTLDFCNARCRSDLGLSLEQIQGTGWQRMLHPDDRDRVLKAWHESVVKGTPYEQEERHRTANGQYRWFLCRGVPQRDEQGRVVRWYGTNTDIEDEKRAEDELRNSEQRWRAVFENARVGIALVDSSLHFVAVNAAIQQMIGYSQDELRSMTCLELLPEDHRPSHEILYKELQEGVRDRFETEERYRRKDGEIIWLRVNGSNLPSAAGEVPLSVVIVEGITERKRLHRQLERERDHLRLLLNLNLQLSAKLEFREFLDAALTCLHQLAGWEWSMIFLPDSPREQLRVYVSRGIKTSIEEGTTLTMDSVEGTVYRSGQPIMFEIRDFPKVCPAYAKTKWMQDIVRDQHLKSGCFLPLVHAGRILGVLFLATSALPDSTTYDLQFFQELAALIAAPLSNALRYDELTSSRDRLAVEKNYIEEQLRSEFQSENIIGRSKGLQHVLRQADTVAPTDATVLVLGETGTGKELLARAIHDRSSRRDQAFIKLDCSAIPATLLEGELFGHERGAFTGAIDQKLGRLEIADKGTLFLDEVGEIPLELQVKLLRVLQDQAFERLGSNRTQHLDIRVIAATNRDLQDMVGKGEFRADLYYRLRVFPIVIPPLRDRREDIPPLVRHYVRKYAQRMRKAIDTIPAAAMEAFTLYSWPGNVRELQHFIERSVILTSGSLLQAPLQELEQVIHTRPATGGPVAGSRTMEEIERESILQALRDSNWVVGGPRGAAAKLGLRRTTLASRMERLGISARRR